MCREVGQPHERRAVLCKHVVDRLLLAGQRHRLHPIRPVGGRLLLEERLALDAVRPALDGQRASFRCARISVCGDGGIVIDHIALCETGLRVHRLVQVRQFQLAPFDVIAAALAPCSRITSAAPSVLASRRPCAGCAAIRVAPWLARRRRGSLETCLAQRPRVELLVLAQPLVGGMAQAARGGPLGELDLRDQPRLAEDRVARRALAGVNGESLAPQRREQLGQPVELCIAEARAHPPGVAERAVGSYHADEQRADPLLRRPSPGSQPPITSS